MKEVILNDKCAHCKNKECHDGYNFCNQAMKKNSFYKNAKLYKGLEVIQRPTYEELEKENAELKEIINNDVDKKIYVQLAKKAELADVQKEQLTTAKEIIKKLRALYLSPVVTKDDVKKQDEILQEVEQFLSKEEK